MMAFKRPPALSQNEIPHKLHLEVQPSADHRNRQDWPQLSLEAHLCMIVHRDHEDTVANVEGIHVFPAVPQQPVPTTRASWPCPPARS